MLSIAAIRYAQLLRRHGFTVYTSTSEARTIGWFIYSQVNQDSDPGMICYGIVEGFESPGNLFASVEHMMPVKPSTAYGSNIFVARSRWNAFQNRQETRPILNNTVEMARYVASPFNLGAVFTPGVSFRNHEPWGISEGVYKPVTNHDLDRWLKAQQKAGA